MFNAVWQSPLHPILLSISDAGLVSCSITDEATAKTKTRVFRLQAPISQMQRIHLEETTAWLEAYFNNQALPELPDFDFSNATDFQTSVWTSLANTEVGQTLTYGELAKLAGSEDASRAVGSAMAANPIVIIIPCHRVLQADGSIGNYSGYGGQETKAWLLKHEGHDLAGH